MTTFLLTGLASTQKACAERALRSRLSSWSAEIRIIGNTPLICRTSDIVSSPESFRAQFTAAGLKVEHSGGYWIKPLSNAQTDEWFTDEMIDAFLALGERYPDIAAEIYVVAS